MEKQDKNLRSHGERPRPPAGCLAGDMMRSGDENSEPIVSPEEKTADTKGYHLLGKITLEQYLTLEKNGYEGEIIRRWTQYHADQEIRRRNLAAQPATGSARHGRERDQPQKAQNEWGCLSCPQCGIKVFGSDQLKKHLARVHRVTQPAAQATPLHGQKRPQATPCKTYSPTKTGLGKYWDSRLWLSPTAADQRRHSETGGPPRKPVTTKLPPGLGVQYCIDGKWRTNTGSQSEISLGKAAAILRVPEPDLAEWVRKTDNLRPRPRSSGRQSRSPSRR